MTKSKVFQDYSLAKAFYAEKEAVCNECSIASAKGAWVVQYTENVPAPSETDETHYVYKLCNELIGQGYTVTVDNGDELLTVKSDSLYEVMACLVSTGYDVLSFHNGDILVGYVVCMYGKLPCEVFSDWSDVDVIEKALCDIDYI